MKDRLLGIFLLAGIFLLSFLFYSSSNNPPNGKTGAPGEGTCADCHSASAGGYNGSLMISGLPSSIEAGSTYEITVTTSYANGSPARTGFQMVCLDGSNNNAGTFSNPSATTTITSSGGRVYFEHNSVQTFGGASSKSWTVEWTAPDGPDGQSITMYAATVIANGNSGTSGDDVLTATSFGTLSVALDPLVATLVESGDISCFEAGDGYAEISVTGGQPPYTYLWSNGETTNPAVNLTPGINTVTVTDVPGSNDILEVFINEPAELMLSSADQVNTSCPESEDGSISLEIAGGTVPYQYVWSNGAAVKDISGLEQGIYTVTVTDANGCSFTEFWVIESENESPEVVILKSANLCEGSSIVLSTDGTFNLYEWSTGEFTSEITVDQPGFYEVTVYDFNGCFAIASIEIVQNTAPIAVILEMNNNFCQQTGSAVLSSQYEASSYLWSTGETTRDITVTVAGSYSLTVANEFGCEAMETYLFEIPENLVSNPGVLSQILCYGGDNASVVLNASGGSSPIGFKWRKLPSGEITDYTLMDTIKNISSGQYELVCYDANNCTVTDTLVFDEPAQLTTGLSFFNESVPEASDGSAQVDPSGGTPPYSISWSNGSSGLQNDSLSQGNYSVTITDANGCMVVESFFISTGECDLSASYEVKNPSCFGFNDGLITIFPVNALEPIEYNWSVDVSSPSPELGDVVAGVYSVTITDSRNCIFIISDILVTEPEVLVLQLEITHETLKDANDGAVLALVSGGTPPYTYLWSNGEITMGLVDLAPGDYSVTITDENACVINDVFTIEASDISSISDAGIDIDIVVYPNPNTGKIFIETENSADYDVSISDMHGRETRLELNGGAIDLSRFGNGNYLLIFKNRHHNTPVIRRIVISK